MIKLPGIGNSHFIQAWSRNENYSNPFSKTEVYQTETISKVTIDTWTLYCCIKIKHVFIRNHIFLCEEKYFYMLTQNVSV